MRRHIGWALASVVSLGIGGLGAASAADMPVKARPLPVPVVAVYNWTGFYIGGNVGYGWGENTDPSLSFVNPGNIGNFTTFFTTGFPGFAPGNRFPNLTPSGVFGGGQVGYDQQFGTWVLGVVADIQAADFRDTRTGFTTAAVNFADTAQTLSAKIDWFGTVRGKVGVAANDWLFYGTGGLAYGQTKSTMKFACSPPSNGCGSVSFAGSNSEVRVGWAAGAGIAKAFGNWNVGVEYLHMDLGRSSVTAFDTTGLFPTTNFTISQRFIEDMVRLTVNYKWGGPVVAKY